MLDPAQEPVRRRHRRRIGAADVAACGQGRERRQRGGLAQRLVAAAVHELEQLDGELDVPQAARPELELAAGLVGGQARDHPPAHGLHVGNEVVALRRLPDQSASTAVQVLGASSASPTANRALSSAWNSQVFAHRS